MDIVIPIVFPDYLIAVTSPKIEIDLLPWFDFDNMTIDSKKHKVPELGHAGVLFISGNKGTTKYFEYGRYDQANLGLVRRIRISDVVIEQGKLVHQSLKKPLNEISQRAGQGGRISGAYIEVAEKFKDMLAFAEGQQKENSNPHRPKYDLTSNSCIHFAKKVTEAAGVDTPWMLDPRPNSYIGEFRGNFPDLDYNLKSNRLEIEGIGTW